jgi:hypothetical protein
MTPDWKVAGKAPVLQLQAMCFSCMLFAIALSDRPLPAPLIELLPDTMMRINPAYGIAHLDFMPCFHACQICPGLKEYWAPQRLDHTTHSLNVEGATFHQRIVWCDTHWKPGR